MKDISIHSDLSLLKFESIGSYEWKPFTLLNLENIADPKLGIILVNFLSLWAFAADIVAWDVSLVKSSFWNLEPDL